MNSSNHRFFVALLPPQKIQTYANEVKQIFVDRYHSRAALKSPPHITLQPPFERQIEQLPILTQVLEAFASQHRPIPIVLSGFGAFVPRVVFINVLKTPELLTVQSDLMVHLEAVLGITEPSKNRPFAPHLTVGFRDLTKQNFKAAWAEFQHQPLRFEFTASHLTLLIHDGQRWTVYSEFPFQSG